MALTSTQRGRAYQKRQQDKGLCTCCGHRELYSCWYCRPCWEKHIKKQEEYRRSKGMIPREEYYKKIAKKPKEIDIDKLQEKYNRIKRVREINSINLKSCVDFLFESEVK